MEVRGQLADLGSLVSPCGLWGQTQVVKDNSLVKFILVKIERYGVGFLVLFCFLWVRRWGLYLATFAFTLVTWKEQLGAFY